MSGNIQLYNFFKMKKEYEKILEWLIEDINISNPKKLFENEHKKELTTSQEIFDVFEIEKTIYRNRPLIRREGLTVYFFPLTIQDYLKDK